METDVKGAAVYIDGTFAGTVRRLMTIRLRQGEYPLDLRASGPNYDSNRKSKPIANPRTPTPGVAECLDR